MNNIKFKWCNIYLILFTILIIIISSILSNYAYTGTLRSYEKELDNEFKLIHKITNERFSLYLKDTLFKTGFVASIANELNLNQFVSLTKHIIDSNNFKINSFYYVKKIFNDERLQFEENTTNEWKNFWPEIPNENLFIHNYTDQNVYSPNKTFYRPVLYFYPYNTSQRTNLMLDLSSKSDDIFYFKDKENIKLFNPFFLKSKNKYILPIYSKIDNTEDVIITSISIEHALTFTIKNFENINGLQILLYNNNNVSIGNLKIKDGEVQPSGEPCDIKYDDALSDENYYIHKNLQNHENYIIKIITRLDKNIHKINTFNAIITLNFIIITTSMVLFFIFYTVKKQYKSRKDKEKHLRKTYDKLMAYVFHAIRNPIHSVMWLTDKILKDYENKETKDKIRLLNHVSEHLYDLTNSFMEMNNNEITDIKLRCKPTDIVSIVRDMFIQQQCVFENDQIKFEIEVNCDPKTINVDPIKLRQILLNAYRNAINATQKGKIKTIINSNEEKIIIEIIDDGTGIKGIEKDDLFKQFKSGNDSNNNFIKCGFGLYISRVLSRKMFGDVNLENRKDKPGCIFTCWLPNINIINEEILINMEISERDIYDNNIQTDEKLSKLKVILCEDDRINNAILIEMLEDIGIEDVKSFTDGSDCLEFIEKNNDWVPDIFLLDIIMKRLNGDKLCSILRNKGFKCPIIALTGNINKSNITDYTDIGFNKVISKPYTTEIVKFNIKKFIYGD